MSETNNERSNPYESPTQVQAFQRSGNSLQLNALPLICGVVSTSLGPSVHWTGELMDTNDGFLSMFIASSCFTLLVSLIGFVSGVYGYLKNGLIVFPLLGTILCSVGPWFVAWTWMFYYEWW